MSNFSIVTPPKAWNEPVLNYEPGSPQRRSLQARLARMLDERIAEMEALRVQRKSIFDHLSKELTGVSGMAYGLWASTTAAKRRSSRARSALAVTNSSPCGARVRA